MDNLKVEIGKYKSIEKGALKGSFSIVLYPDKMYMNNLNHFAANSQEWVTFPQQRVPGKEGGKDAYYTHIGYHDKEKEKLIKDTILKELKAFLAKGTYESRTEKAPESKVQGDSSEIWF